MKGIMYTEGYLQSKTVGIAKTLGQDHSVSKARS